MAEIVSTLCHMCNRLCGMKVHVDGGKIVKVEGMPEHPISQGGLCARGLAAVQFEYDPNRLLHPLKRVGERGEGRWEQISWDEAMNTTVDNLLRVKEKYGAQAICAHKGQAGGWGSRWAHLRRFLNLLGSPNYGSHGHLCYIPKMMGQFYTLGAVPSSDVENTRCLVMWGHNGFCTNVANFGRRLLDAKARGAKLVVIDPRFTELASKADIYLQPRPGTDNALALGMLNVILAEKLYDAEFVQQWTYGFDKLSVFAQEYTPERVSDITWVPAETIRQVARLYATTRPALIEIGNGVDQHSNAVQASRAITILTAITGNIDRPGTSVFVPPTPLADMTLKENLGPQVKSVCKYPLYYQIWGALPGPDLVDAILTGEPYPLKAMIIQAGDPAMSLSDSSRIRDALMQLEFIVVHDIFLTASAELADIVFPAANFLESTDFVTYPYGSAPPVNTKLMGLIKRVVAPPGECGTDLEFIFELARRMGYGDYFPWQTVEEALDEELKPSGITLKDLEEYPQGIMRTIKAEDLYEKYQKQGFATPTKKIELYSTIFEESGYDPLPTFKEPGESPLSRPDLASEYPLICGDSTKPGIYTHTQFRTLPWLKDILPEPWVEIHPQKAAELGIESGDKVMVETIRGSIKVRAQLTEGINPETVFMPHGWGQPYAHGERDNFITPDSPRCPLSASTANRSFLCRVRKA